MTNFILSNNGGSGWVKDRDGLNVMQFLAVYDSEICCYSVYQDDDEIGQRCGLWRLKRCKNWVAHIQRIQF